MTFGVSVQSSDPRANEPPFRRPQFGNAIDPKPLIGAAECATA